MAFLVFLKYIKYILILVHDKLAKDIAAAIRGIYMCDPALFLRLLDWASNPEPAHAVNANDPLSSYSCSPASVTFSRKAIVDTIKLGM